MYSKKAYKRLIFCLTFSITSVSAEPFEFITLGDTAYCPDIDNPRYDRLITLINDEQPAFSIHVGDTGAPSQGNCSDMAQDTVAMQFSKISHPLVYTPGDNEWSDCAFRLGLSDKHQASPIADPFERLEYLRTRFFSNPISLGAKPMPVVRQSDESEHKQMVENLRWNWNEVIFATVHAIGSHNGLVIGTEQAVLEFNARNNANLDWIQRTFDIAKRENAKAVVIVFHVDMYREINQNSPAYIGMKHVLNEETTNFDGQVLFINGDSHKFLIDKPTNAMNVTRLVVYGAPDIRAVRVTVEPDTPWVFGFIPLFERGEGRTEEERRQCE